MTKKKSIPRTAKALGRKVRLILKAKLQELESSLGFDVTNIEGGITVTLGNTKPTGCLVNRQAKLLSDAEKVEIRRLFTWLANEFNLKLIAKTIAEAGKQMICLFELKPSAA
jgi:hypothetical protein